jgi:hypothetical protein
MGHNNQKAAASRPSPAFSRRLVLLLGLGFLSLLAGRGRMRAAGSDRAVPAGALGFLKRGKDAAEQYALLLARRRCGEQVIVAGLDDVDQLALQRPCAVPVLAGGDHFDLKLRTILGDEALEQLVRVFQFLLKLVARGIGVLAEQAIAMWVGRLICSPADTFRLAPRRFSSLWIKALEELKSFSTQIGRGDLVPIDTNYAEVPQDIIRRELQKCRLIRSRS